MTLQARFWRLTLLVSIKRAHLTYEFRHTLTAVPGTRREAVRHMKAVCLKTWPSAKLKLVRAIPDRQAEAKEARDGAA